MYKFILDILHEASFCYFSFIKWQWLSDFVHRQLFMLLFDLSVISCLSDKLRCLFIGAMSGWLYHFYIHQGSCAVLLVGISTMTNSFCWVV